jgi:hypothetical protein
MNLTNCEAWTLIPREMYKLQLRGGEKRNIRAKLNYKSRKLNNEEIYECIQSLK